MTRRRYDMARRADKMADTRRRILEATLAVHDQQGIVAAHWPDIAARAGVSLATLYRHYSSLEALVAACGALTMERMPPPAPGQGATVFDGATSRQERLRRLVGAAFEYYERAGTAVDNVRRDRTRLRTLARAHAHFEQAFDALVDEALRPLGVAPAGRRIVRALIDVRVWQALREHGLSRGAAVRIVVQASSSALRRSRATKGRRAGDADRG